MPPVVLTTFVSCFNLDLLTQSVCILLSTGNLFTSSNGEFPFAVGATRGTAPDLRPIVVKNKFLITVKLLTRFRFISRRGFEGCQYGAFQNKIWTIRNKSPVQALREKLTFAAMAAPICVYSKYIESCTQIMLTWK